MARGRMISKSLSTSQRYAALFTTAPALAEFCQSLYPLIVAHTDDFGRLQGDPFTVKHQCHPTSPRSLEEFANGLQALHDVGLIAWYLVSARRYIQVQNFEPHQQGLHKRTRSQFPRLPGISGNEAESPGQEKRTKEKGTEEKKEHDIRSFLTLYEQEFSKRFGDTPVISRPKDPKLVKGLLAKYGPLRLGQLLLRFFDSQDAFIQQSGYTIGVFYSCLNKVLTTDRQVNAKRAPRGCRHEPPCRDDAEHTRRDLEDRRRVS